MHIPFYSGGLLDNGGKAGHFSALIVPLTHHLRITFTLIAVSMVIRLAGRQAGRPTSLKAGAALLASLNIISTPTSFRCEWDGSAAE